MTSDMESRHSAKGSERESVVDARFGKYKSELPYNQDKSPAFNVAIP